jgi:Family of unknown function (DUF6010)
LSFEPLAARGCPAEDDAMPAHVVPHLAALDWILPAVVAAAWIAFTSLFAEPRRTQVSAILLAGAAGAYFNGGFGLWEQAFAVALLYVAYRGLGSYRMIGIGWLMHAAWDVAHHFWGQPILAFSPPSSAGCAIADPLIAIWFLAGAPSLRDVIRARRFRTA